MIGGPDDGGVGGEGGCGLVRTRAGCDWAGSGLLSAGSGLVAVKVSSIGGRRGGRGGGGDGGGEVEGGPDGGGVGGEEGCGLARTRADWGGSGLLSAGSGLVAVRKMARRCCRRLDEVLRSVNRCAMRQAGCCVAHVDSGAGSGLLTGGSGLVTEKRCSMHRGRELQPRGALSWCRSRGTAGRRMRW